MDRKIKAQVDCNAAMTDISKEISELIGIPEGKTIKSLGSKSDVKIGLHTGEIVDMVSTKSWIGTTDPSLSTAGGSRTSEIGFIAVIPDRWVGKDGRPTKEFARIVDKINAPEDTDLYKDYSPVDGSRRSSVVNGKEPSLEQLKMRDLESLGLVFDEDNAIVMNMDFAKNMAVMSNEDKRCRGQRDRVCECQSGLDPCSGCFALVTGITSPTDIKDKKLRRGFDLSELCAGHRRLQSWRRRLRSE